MSAIPFPRQRGPRLVFGAASLLCAIAVFWLPYHVPVTPTVSQSYATGFNNHAALGLFLLTGALFCLAVGSSKTVARVRDRALPLWLLLGALVLGSALMLAWRKAQEHKPLGPEPKYLINRQIHVAEGARLYQDVEYIYGPLLIYPGVLLQRFTRLGAVHAYMPIWFAFDLLGTGMLWFVVARLDLANPRRWLVFAYLYGLSLLALHTEEVQYTPLRGYFAAFAAVALATYWRRTRSGTGMAVLMALAVLVGFAISPEQGIGLGLGLPAYAVLLAITSPRYFAKSAAAGVVVAAALCGLLALRIGELRSSAGVAAGGLNFPVLPSPLNLFILSTYLFAMLVVYQAFRRKQWESAVVPLGLCGLPMMSSALGRCDPGHMTSVIPLYLLGLFWLTRQRWLVWPWLALTLWFFFPTSELLYRLHALQQRTIQIGSSQRPATQANVGLPIPAGVYYAPFSFPIQDDGYTRWSAGTGYFFGLQDVLTLADGERKAQEIRNLRHASLLLPDGPEQPAPLFWAPDEDVRVTAATEGSTWAPPERHALPVKAALRELITNLYEPTEYREDGWRVWRRRSASAP